MRKIYSIVCIVVLIQTGLLAQPQPNKNKKEVRCRTSEMMKKLYQAHPQSKKEAQEFSEFTKNFTETKSEKATGYVIPVVFHVFGTSFNGKYVDNALIQDALQKTNEDFQGITADWNQIIYEFDGVKQPIDITFKLAQLDPYGNPTTGITYNPTMSGFGNGSGYDSQIQQYAWDNYKYFNVYIQNDLYNDGTTNNSGVCWYPDTWMSNNNLARCVYNGAYIGNNTDENFRSVLTHEFGHYLNLIHPFEGGCPDASGCSYSGDMICDTPPEDYSSMEGALNCEGNVTNWQNFMTYTSNYAMFTIDQVYRMEAALQHAARYSLWQESNLIATGVSQNLGPRLSLSSNLFDEAYQNNGAVSTNATLAAIDGAQFATSGNLTQGTHYYVSNVPSGLSMQITVNSSTEAIVSFNGNANSHTNANDVSNITITFLNPAIVGGTSTLYSANINNLSINFINPYQMVYENITDVTASASEPWTYFTIQNENDFGVWYDEGKLRLETYGKSAISEGSTRNLTYIPYQESINSSRNWVAGGAYPDEHDLRSDSYTVWDGQTGYIGFQFEFLGHPCYGWFKVTVASNGTSFTLTEYAYNEEPYGSIQAGTTDSGVVDTEAPSKPNGLTSTNSTHKSVDLNWNASTDNYGVSYYTVKFGSNTVNVGNVTFTTVTGLNANTTYSFTVTATDAAGNESNPSNSVNVTTDSEPTCTSVTLTLSLDSYPEETTWEIKNSSGAVLYSDGPYSNPADQGITITENFCLEPACYDFSIYDSYGDGLGDDPIGSYELKDEDNNTLASGTGEDFTYEATTDFCLGSVSDTEAPTAPTGLTAGTITETSISIIWNASIDNIGVTGYEVLVNGSVDQTVTDISATITGLSCETSYTLNVRALDAAENVSATSNTIYASTATCFDNEAPSIPSGLTASNITETSVDLSWNASTDNIGVAGYDLAQDEIIIQTVSSTSVSISGLLCETTYTFTVRAKDAAGNISKESTPISVTTKVCDGCNNYCVSSSNRSSFEYISGVGVGTFANTSGASNYTDFTSLAINVQKGQSYNVTLTPGFSGEAYNEFFSMWIDFNANCTFDAGELVFESGATKTAVSGTINVPANATLGVVKARVSMKYNSLPTACENFADGEVEDYTVNITASVSDTEAPTAPTNLAASNITTNSVDLSWTASTDNVGVTDYDLLQEGSVIRTITGTTTSVLGLLPNTNYRFAVKANDAAENSSALSNSITIITQDVGTTPPSYCTASGTNGPEHIARVQVGTIDNSTGRTTYSNFTSMSTSMSVGNSYPITISIGDVYIGDKATCWVDWNIDGDFDDANEKIALSISGSTATGTITVPSSATVGTTGLRVRVFFYIEGDNPCNSQTYGEVEDYAVVITASGPSGSLAKASDKLKVDVYPNPNNGTFTVAVQNSDGQVIIKIISQDGAIVEEISGVGNEIPVSLNVSPGTYMLQVSTNNNTLTQLIIIN